VHRDNICIAALSALAHEGTVSRDKVTLAIEKFGIDADRPAPRHR
jgi:pyruvate dehydrogenase complex dehydrogenase (E1) component